MAKKIVTKEEIDSMYRQRADALPLAELWTMFQIVNADYNATAGHRNAVAKGIVASRYSELKNELYKRVYGCDPFNLQVAEGEVEGETPENVLEGISKSQRMVQDAKEAKNFVVEKNPESEQEE